MRLRFLLAGIFLIFLFGLSAQTGRFSYGNDPDTRQRSSAQKPDRAASFKSPDIKKPARTMTMPTKPAPHLMQKSAMQVPRLVPPPRKKRPNQEMINWKADHLFYNAYINPDFQILSGNVRFKHEGATMYCDSAHFFQKTNSMYAVGNVRMEQGDTLFLYGAWMYYDGITKLAQVREKVRMENRSVTLFTDSLNYDRVTNVGYFFDGGLLVDEKNELSSEYGQYSSDTKVAHFRNDVKLVNPNFVLTNRELGYNTTTHVAVIDVPTDIVSDSGYVYTTKGLYNTDSESCTLYNRSYVISDRNYLTGDTVLYDQKNKIGRAYGNVLLEDTTDQITLKGEYGYNEEATGFALMTGKALLVEHSGKDTLYLHADTLITRNDSIYKSITAYRNTRFYRNDFQGACDSLYYTGRDSILSFYYNPVLWSERQQLTGEFMQLHTKENKPDWLHIQRAAMVISQEADSFFNQSSGKDLKAYFDSSQVVKVEIRGNAETVYMPKDDNLELIGLNHLEGSSLDLFRSGEKVKKIVVWPEPKGRFFPLDKVDPSAKYLQNFVWYVQERPSHPEDVFRIAKIKGIAKSSEPNDERAMDEPNQDRLPEPATPPTLKTGGPRTIGKPQVR